MIRFLLFCISFAVLFSSQLVIGDPSHSKSLVFGVVPQQSSSKLARLWGPILAHLSEKTGQKIIFGTAHDIPTFERRLSEGRYDIAYMNPYHYTVFHEAPGYLAIAKQKNKMIKGIIVVSKNSSFASIDDLFEYIVTHESVELAFPAPAAFAASLLPRAHFKQKGINIIPRYVSSHDSVYRTVAKGIYLAGGGVMRTFNNMAPEIKSELKVLWSTEGYTPHAVAVHPRLSPDIRDLVQNELILMSQEEVGAELFKKLKMISFEIAKNKDWNDIRSLNLLELDRLIK